jgi:glycosyltransferase involved in cell wall biosynthesis
MTFGGSIHDSTWTSTDDGTQSAIGPHPGGHRVTRRTTRDADVIFIGFVLGHGGDALQMLSLAEGLQRRGARVRIILPANEQAVTFQQRCDELGVPCERSDLVVADMHGGRQRLPNLVKLLRSLRAPIVHFHTGNSCLPRSAIVALDLLRFPRAFVTLQSPYETIDAGSRRARFWAWGARRRFVAVISPSDHASAFQRRCGVPAERTVTVRNAVDAKHMASGVGDGPRQVLGVGREEQVVMFCSRVDAQKRPLDAVRAFAAIATEFPNAVLAVVGRGDLEGDVAAEATRLGVADRVHLVGYQTNVPDWLAAATVWILPTERENFSVAVLEAMAAGCAILATMCPGNDEILVDGDNALTFAVGDVDAAADGLRRLLGDPSLRAHLSRGAKTTSAEHTAERMVDGYCDVYTRAVEVPSFLRK